MDSILGPCLYFPASSGCQFLNGKDNATYNGRTFAALFRFDTIGINQYLVSNSTGGGGSALSIGGISTFQMAGFGSTSRNSAFTPVVDVPYLCAMSQDETNGTHFVLKNLLTGSIKSEIVSGGNTPTAASGGYNVGSAPNNSGAARAAMRAAMYSADFVHEASLIKWA